MFYLVRFPSPPAPYASCYSNSYLSLYLSLTLSRKYPFEMREDQSMGYEVSILFWRKRTRKSKNSLVPILT